MSDDVKAVLNIVGTFSFLYVFGLATLFYKERRVSLELVVGIVIAGLMFAYAMVPARFGPPVPALWNQPVRFAGLALLCVGAALSAVSMQDGGPKLLRGGLLAVCGGLFLLTAALPFLAFLVAAGAFMARTKRT